MAWSPENVSSAVAETKFFVGAHCGCDRPGPLLTSGAPDSAETNTVGKIFSADDQAVGRFELIGGRIPNLIGVAGHRQPDRAIGAVQFDFIEPWLLFRRVNGIDKSAGRIIINLNGFIRASADNSLMASRLSRAAVNAFPHRFLGIGVHQLGGMTGPASAPPELGIILIHTKATGFAGVVG